MRAIEYDAIMTLGIPEIVLMENAAYKTSLHCLGRLKATGGKKAAVVAGPGSNGGDGLAAARYLYMGGVEVRVFFFGDESADPGTSAAANLRVIKNLKIPVYVYTEPDFWRAAEQTLYSADLILDALFGIGASREVGGAYKKIIEMMDASDSYVVSADVPSGLDADTGRVLGCAVRADMTVTFTYPKTGLLVYPGAGHAGQLIVEDIGITRLGERYKTSCETLGRGEIKKLLPVRRKDSNKGSHGKVVVLAGSGEMSGAAYLTCGAAYAAGAGLVRACATFDVASALHIGLPEALTVILPDSDGFIRREGFERVKKYLNGADAVVMGPGLGDAECVAEFAYSVIEYTDAPVVLDADGLNAVARDPDILLKLKKLSVVTPHPGEMSRLTGRTIKEITGDPLGAARSFAEKYGVVTLLKGARTVIALPDGTARINTTGNPALAKAGTGDVLAGVIGAFIAQGAGAFDAATLGAYIHGAAGDAAADEIGEYGVLAGDLFKYIPRVIKKIGEHP